MVKKKYTFLFVTLLLILVAILALVLFACHKNGNISGILDEKNHKITKIVFLDGTGKNTRFELTDKGKIEDFMNNYINRYQITEDKNKGAGAGYLRAAQFCSGNTIVWFVTFGTDYLIIGDKYYHVNSGELSTSQIDNFIKSANNSWKPWK